jgi:PleD family two-component response regulator
MGACRANTTLGLLSFFVRAVPTPRRPLEAPIPQKRILVVDDNRDAADSLSMILKFLGSDVRVARDGPEAIEEFHTYDPAVVLLDIGMPGRRQSS